jgi:hypothetical protein
MNDLYVECSLLVIVSKDGLRQRGSRNRHDCIGASVGEVELDSRPDELIEPNVPFSETRIENSHGAQTLRDRRGVQPLFSGLDGVTRARYVGGRNRERSVRSKGMKSINAERGPSCIFPYSIPQSPLTLPSRVLLPRLRRHWQSRQSGITRASTTRCDATPASQNRRPQQGCGIFASHLSHI